MPSHNFCHRVCCRQSLKTIFIRHNVCVPERGDVSQTDPVFSLGSNIRKPARRYLGILAPGFNVFSPISRSSAVGSSFSLYKWTSCAFGNVYFELCPVSSLMRSLHESMFSMFKFLLVYLLFGEDYGAVEIHGQPLVYNFSVSLQFLSGISFGSWQRKFELH